MIEYFKMYRAFIVFTLMIFSYSGVQAETGLPWSSDFETGDLSEWNGYGSVGITSTDCQSGSYCARNPLVANTVNGPYREHFFGDHYTQNLEKVDDVYLEFHSKIDVGYELTGWGVHKLAIINITDGSGQRKYQVYIVIHPDGQYGIEHSYIDTWQFFGLNQNSGDSNAAIRLGQWDKIKMRVKLNTPNTNDGIVEMWVNDELIMSHNRLNLRQTTNYSLNKLIISSYTTGQNGSDGVQYWDNWKLYEPSMDSTPPMAPTMNLVN